MYLLLGRKGRPEKAKSPAPFCWKATNPMGFWRWWADQMERRREGVGWVIDLKERRMKKECIVGFRSLTP